MEIGKIKGKFVNVLGVLIFKILLELAYIYCVSPNWINLQFYYTPNWISCALSCLYCTLIAWVIPEDESRMSVLVCQFFLLTSVVPFYVFYWTNDESSWFAFLVFVMIMVMFWLANRPGEGWVIKEFASRDVASMFLWIIFVGYVLSAIWICIKQGGIDLRALSFVDAYEIREEGTSLNMIEEYLLQWVAKAMTPFFMAYFLMHKRYIMCGICVLIQVVVYFTFGHKAFLFSVALFVMLFVLTKWFRKIRLMYSLTFGCMAAATFLYGIGVNLKVFWLVAWQGTMRLFIEPAKNKFWYYEFFKEREKLFFSEGIIGKLFSMEYPYEHPIGFVVNDYFMQGSSWSNSNTGVIGDAYSQMGEFGMLFCGILLGLLICVTERVSTHIPAPYKMALFSYICITLNDNPLQTTLLTGGWIVMLLLMLLLNSELHNEQKIDNILENKETLYGREENTINECGQTVCES